MRSRTRLLRTHVLGGVLLAHGFVVAPARADSATADALFEAAKDLMDEGRLEEACPKFEASYEADRTLGTLLNIANCYEQLGRVATAWARWGEAVELARRVADDRVEFASKRRQALTPRLPKLTIVVDDKTVDLDIMRDDTPLEPATFGLALPVDPGRRVVRVMRGDRVLHQESVDLTEAEQSTVELRLREIAAQNADVEDEPRAGLPPALPPPPPEAGEGQLIVGFIVGGAGLAGLLTAGVIGGVALSKKGDADSPGTCVGQDQQLCTRAGIDSLESAETLANVSQWVGIGSLLVTAIGVTLVLTAPSESGALSERAGVESPPARATVGPWFQANAGGVGAELVY